MQGQAQQLTPTGSPQVLRNFDYSWVSVALYLAMVGWWGWLVLPDLRLHHLPAALIFAGGLVAFARSRSAGQKALALQAGLVLSPGTGDLVSRVFWGLVPASLHGQAATSTGTVWVYLSFSLPWLLLMFTPGVWRWVGRRRVTTQPGISAPEARPTPTWRLALLWMLATTAGWLAPHLVSASAWARETNLLWPLLLVAPGFGQWLVLRSYVRRAGLRMLGLWVVLSAAGVLVGIYLAAARQLLDLYIGGRDGLDSVLSYSTLGTAIGIAQWLRLRRWSPRAHWWILANMLAWPSGWALAKVLGLAWPGLATSGLEMVVTAGLAGLFTGLLLGRLVPARDS